MSEINQPKVKRIITAARTEQNTPDFEFKNPVDKNIELNGISIIPDNSFRSRGRLRVSINDVPLDIINGDDLVNVSKIQLIEGNSIKELKRGQGIKFFMWNPTDDLSIAITIGITLGKL